LTSAADHTSPKKLTAKNAKEAKKKVDTSFALFAVRKRFRAAGDHNA
jgi:hypothetical protein